MKKNIFKYTIYFIILFAIFYICLNSTTRRLVSRIFEIHKLQANIEDATKTNLEYKKRLNYLQTKPEQMDKMVKTELDVLADGEIEYKFDDYEDENNKSEVLL